MTEGVERGCFCINTHPSSKIKKPGALPCLAPRSPTYFGKNTMRNERPIKCVMEGKSEWFSVSSAEWHSKRVSCFFFLRRCCPLWWVAVIEFHVLQWLRLKQIIFHVKSSVVMVWRAECCVSNLQDRVACLVRSKASCITSRSVR